MKIVITFNDNFIEERSAHPLFPKLTFPLPLNFSELKRKWGFLRAGLSPVSFAAFLCCCCCWRIGAKEEKQGSLIEQCKEICVICQLGGSYCKKLRSWKCCPRSQAFSRPRSQFFTMWPDLEPVNNLFIFSKIFNSFTSTYTSTPFCKCSKLTDVVKSNFFIFILQ